MYDMDKLAKSGQAALERDVSRSGVDNKRAEVLNFKAQYDRNIRADVGLEMLIPEYAQRESSMDSRANMLVDAAYAPPRYAKWIDSLVVHRYVRPGDDIACVIKTVADASDSLLLVSISHGARTTQDNYDWNALLTPILSKLDGAIFVACKAKLTIYPSIRDLPLLVWATDENVNCADLFFSDAVRQFCILYLSTVTRGEYSNGSWGRQLTKEPSTQCCKPANSTCRARSKTGSGLQSNATTSHPQRLSAITRS